MPFKTYFFIFININTQLECLKQENIFAILFDILEAVDMYYPVRLKMKYVYNLDASSSYVSFLF